MGPSMKWIDIKRTTLSALDASGLPPVYRERLEFELKEIEKQATQEYWEEITKTGQTFAHNKNGLVLPWLLGMTPIDPIEGEQVVYAGEGNIEMDGIEIELENGVRVPMSARTMVRTERGMVAAADLVAGDEIA
jgi:hypothetical protein